MSKKLLLCVIVVIFLAALLAIGILHPKAKHGKAITEVNLYQKQADTICAMLNNAFKLYQHGHPKKAYGLAENTYWEVYDNVLEIKYRAYVTPAYIFAVEGKFHEVSASMNKPVTAKHSTVILQQIKALCTEVNTEANYLIKHR